MTKLWSISKDIEGNFQLLATAADLLLVMEYLKEGKSLRNMRDEVKRGVALLEIVEKGARSQMDPQLHSEDIIMSVVLGIEEELNLRPTQLADAASKTRKEIEEGRISAEGWSLIEAIAKVTMRNISREVDALSSLLR
ncbi:MAG: hypothetical protein DRP08_01685 [Candidatus Aenigmatarchaeota archaeon]|nr:MAG: hypothetical protein DRP08_01685 [Candidatus Aenigmarchaeota archaeon]